LAQAHASAGHVETGLKVLAEALAFVERSAERYYESELHRLEGELLLTQGEEAAAEASFHRAIEIARGQHAKTWELRATVSLCRLWQKQGKRQEARQRLAEIYAWFSEGFDTPDLKEARALLDGLSS
jgi:predicted ATPase